MKAARDREICGLQLGGLSDIEGCICADRAMCDSSCTAEFDSVSHIEKYSDFVGPMVPHFGNHNSTCVGLACVTGGMPEFENHCRQLRDASFDCDSLDAPDYVPAGGASAHIYSRFSLASFHEWRV